MRIHLFSRITLAAIVLSAPVFPVATSGTADSWTVTYQPSNLVNGSAVLFRVAAPSSVQALHGTWADRTVDFRFSSACECWFAIAGVDLDTRPGKHTLQLKGSAKDNPELTFSDEVVVHEKHYPLSSLTVAPKFVQPPPEVQARIEEEQALKKKLFAEVLPQALWMGRFLPPVATGVSGGFGAARVLNGVKGRPHEGADYHAPIGTTVRASNRGTVLLARNLYYEGNCVALDHGQGLVTLYMHLSEIKVREGQTVESGEVLGLSGNTGRSTGPHLHFAVRWQGVYVDPGTMIAIVPPQ
jgi:murein DD-endopeptidase MepM/ murein hydrolase activator NlpD